MRNDARPIGEDSPASPVGGHESPIESERPDSRGSHKHDRQSHIVNEEAEEREPTTPEDPVMPSSESSLNTKI
jgi:hypothetical protein